MISGKQIILLALLLIIGYMYSKYNNKISKDVEKEEYDLIHKFLANDDNKMDRSKPFMWVHVEYDVNERWWKNFGSRNTTNLNQPYLYLTIRSIIEKCGDSFNICIIDDKVFNKILRDCLCCFLLRLFPNLYPPTVCLGMITARMGGIL